jgi:hypothetical protein
MLDRTDTARLGHNNPPSPIEIATATTADLIPWMADHPAIQDEAAARGGNVMVDRARANLEEMEAERDGLVRPLNVATVRPVRLLKSSWTNSRSGCRRTRAPLRSSASARLRQSLSADQGRRGEERQGVAVERDAAAVLAVDHTFGDRDQCCGRGEGHRPP